MENIENDTQPELFVNWFGHELTESEHVLCEDAFAWAEDWDLTPPDGIEEKYEEKTGKSCVYWGIPGTPYPPCEDDLPRPEGYETNGYTNEFIEWLTDTIFRAVRIVGKDNLTDIWEFVRAL